MTAPDGNTSSTATSTVVLQADVNPYTQQMQVAERQTNAVANSVNSLASSLFNLTKTAGHKLINLGRDDVVALGAATTSAGVFEKQLSTLRATSAVTGASFGGMQRAVEQAFTKFPVGRGQVVALAESLTNLGVTGVRDIGQLTQTFIKLGAATGESTTGLAAGLTQLSRLMGQSGAVQIGNYANALLTVSKNSGVSATSVLDFSQAIAPMARQAGIGEAAVLGISAAFSKAGADGYVAANTFNKIVNDISTLTRTGSPQLTKYAQFIGMTVSEFKKMPAKDQVTGIFEAIGKGGPQALNFVNELGLGTRALSSVQSLAQSGGLRAAINQSVGASTNQNNLNKGADAAFHNFTDSMARVRNEFTQLADQIGGPLLTPLRWMANALADFMAVINKIVKGLGPIPAILGAIVGLVAPFAGGMLVHAGAIGTAALARYVVRSGPRRAFGTGRDIGGRMGEGMSQAEAEAAYLAGGAGRQLPPDLARTRAPYQAGMWWGRRGFGGGAAGEGPGMFRRAGAYATQAVTGLPLYFSRGQREMLRDSTLNDYDRSAYTRAPGGIGAAFGRFRTGADELATARGGVLGMFGAGAMRLARGTLGLAGQTIATGANLFGRAAAMPFRAAGRAMFGGGGDDSAAQRSAQATEDAVRKSAAAQQAATTRAATFTVNAAGQATRAAEAEQRAAAAQTRAAGAQERAAARQAEAAERGALAQQEGATAGGLRAGMRGMGGRLGAGMGIMLGGQMLGDLVGGGKGGVRGGIGTTLSDAGTGAGIGFMVGGAPGAAIGGLAGGVYGAMKGFSHEPKIDYDPATSYNGISKYDALLNQSSNNLADFSNNVETAANKLSKLPDVKGQTLADVAKVTTADKTTATAANFKYTQPGMASLPSLHKGGLGAAVAYVQTLDIQHGGMDPTTFQAVKEDLVKRYGVAGAQQVLNTYLQTSPSGQSGKVNYAELGKSANRFYLSGGVGKYKDIVGQAISGAQSQAQQSIGPSGKITEQGQRARVGAVAQIVANSLPRGYSSSTEDVYKEAANQLKAAYGGSVTEWQEALVQGAMDGNTQQGIVNHLAKSKAGRKTLAAAGIDPKHIDPKKLTGLLNTAAGTFPAPANSGTNQQLRAQGGLGAFAAGSATVQAALTTQQTPAAQQRAAEDLANQAAGASSSMGDAIGQLTKLSDAMGGADTVTGQLIASAAQWARTLQGFQLPYMSRAQQVTSTRQTLAASYTAARAPGASQATQDQYKQDLQTYEQSKSSQYDWLKSLYQTQLSFRTQMYRAEKDYNQQRQRGQDDFQLQMTRSESDYLLNRRRQLEDFNTQMARQAQQAAQSIYDPFKRVQTQYTTDAGTLEQNLEDQNRRISQQRSELARARRLGLSMQTIRTMNLADPANAQQLDSIVNGIAQNPSLARQINQQVSQRVRSTRSLTQSGYNQSYVNEVADFRKSMRRASNDNDRTRQRAEADQQKSLDRMADDQRKTMRRAANDLATSMQELTGTFGEMYSKVWDKWSGVMNKYAPKAAQIVQSQLDALKSKNPELFDPNYTGGAAATTPNVMGINAKGQIGEYDAKGHWNPYKGYVNPSQAQHLGAVRSPLTGHADGGVSLVEHVARISEQNKPEAIIPLDHRGQTYMAGMYYAIARAVVQQMNVGSRPMMPSGPSTVHQDYSTRFTGDIHVEGVQDTRKLLAELEQRKRLARLASAGRGPG